MESARGVVKLWMGLVAVLGAEHIRQTIPHPVFFETLVLGKEKSRNMRRSELGGECFYYDPMSDRVLKQVRMLIVQFCASTSQLSPLFTKVVFLLIHCCSFFTLLYLLVPDTSKYFH